jgi:hypothetical protein
VLLLANSCGVTSDRLQVVNWKCDGLLLRSTAPPFVISNPWEMC